MQEKDRITPGRRVLMPPRKGVWVYSTTFLKLCSHLRHSHSLHRCADLPHHAITRCESTQCFPSFLTQLPRFLPRRSILPASCCQAELVDGVDDHVVRISIRYRVDVIFAAGTYTTMLLPRLTDASGQQWCLPPVLTSTQVTVEA